MSNLLNYDVWHSRYYEGATFAGDFEMPVLRGTNRVPGRLIRFSDSRSHKRNDPNAWVIPYEHDKKLERVWRNAFNYLDGFLEHPGIVSWDFSMYRRMPFALQLWNCFRGRLIGSLYERMGGECIPNVRPTDMRSLRYAFDGLPAECTIAMGTAGNLRAADDRAVFELYVNEAVKRLHPSCLVVYGNAPEQIFHSAFDAGIPVKAFPTQTRCVHPDEEGVK